MGVFSLGGWSRQIHAGFLVSRATQDTNRVRLGFAYGGLTLSARLFHAVRLPKFRPTSWSYNPGAAWTVPVWAPPRSLATTCGITFVFSSWGYLDVSVPPVRLRTLSADSSPSDCWVVPFGNPRVKGHLHLTAAYRSLSRPSSPPRAKASTRRPNLLSPV